MDGIHVVLADHDPVVDAGMHMLEQARQLFEDLTPQIVLIEMNLASASTLPDEQRLPSAPVAPRVVALHDDHHRIFVFGLLASASATELTNQTALQTIMGAMATDRDGTGDRNRHGIMATAPPRQREGAPTAIPDLTVREVQVLQQLITGKTNRAIGQHLGISEWTVRYYLKTIYQKLAVNRRSEAIVRVVEAGWMHNG